MKEKIPHERPFVLYNAETQKPIGIFRKLCHAAKYLKINDGTAYNSAMRRGTILKSDLPFKVAIRFASEEYCKMLGEENVFIIDESGKKFDKRILVGFTSTRYTLYKKHSEHTPFIKKL